jgi:hypothetical protein
MIYDELIQQLQAVKSPKELPDDLFYELLDSTITTGMVLAFNGKSHKDDKLSHIMSDIKHVINQHIDKKISELKQDE